MDKSLGYGNNVMSINEIEEDIQGAFDDSRNVDETEIGTRGCEKEISIGINGMYDISEPIVEVTRES